jgi:hypothetical protein
MTCLFLTGTQPDQGVEPLIMTIEYVCNGRGGVLPITADPPHFPLRQRIKEAKAEITQIKEQQTACRKSLEEVEHVHPTVLEAPPHATPAAARRFSPQIKEPYQFASKTGWVLCAQATQGTQIPSHNIESGFIETKNTAGKHSLLCWYRPASRVGESSIDELPQVLEGSQASLKEPFDQAIACEPDWGKRADWLQAEQAPPVRKRVHALQGTQQ